MAVSFESFLWSLTQQESGGNYSAVGVLVKGDRAYGRYQVMGANIPSWTAKYYGKRLTPQQFLANHEAQDAVVRGVLKGYYDKYGPEGAAAMWYSGQSNPNKTYGNPPVYKYVQQVMSRASGNPSATLSGGGGSGGGGGGTPAIDPGVLAEEYGLVKQLIDSVPELAKLFKEAVAGGWDAKKFQARLANTTWWKTHSEKQRQYLIKSYTDPASFREDRENAKYRIGELANQVGAWAAINNEKLMNDLIWGVLYNGWSDAELKYHIANILTFSPEGNLAGAGGEFQSKMASMAWSNGVKLDNNWYMNYYRMILQGVSTEQQAMQDIRNKAAAMFPGFRDQIMAGQNMIDIASPYLQGMSSILEINPSSLDLFDQTIVGALNYKDSKGVTGAKPLWQFEVDLRKDQRWLKTSNAREGLFGVAHKVAQDFGVLF